MNKKYLFGMLLSGALLTACTADDALDAAKVANKGEMAAPVFTVSKDDGDLQNRAHYVPGGQDNKVAFDYNDKMSLFHGISTDGIKTVSGYQNAIYLADEETEEGLSFHTYSMVQPGYAIMIYPADLGFDQTSGTNNTGLKAPVVTIDPVQDATMKERTPYISEFLYLGKPEDKKAANAGFGETYEITLRRAAGTLRAQLSLKNASNVPGADPLVVRAVEINYPKSGLFALEIPVKAGDADMTDNDALHKNHPSWARMSELDLENVKTKTDSLKTKDVVNNIATFTILPAGPVEGKVDKVTDGTVKVYTNYGIVTLSTKDDKVFGGDKKALDGEVLQSLADKLYKVGKEGDTEFVGQGIGGPVGTIIEVDMNKLKLNGLHIDNEKDLITALKVYDALYQDKKDEEVNLILDGTQGTFEMSANTLAELSKHMTAGTGLVFSACKTTGEALTKIKVTSTTETEVPSLIFAGDPTNTVALELAGPWKWTDVTAVDSNESKDKSKRMNKVTGITFLKDAVVTLQNKIAVRDGESNYAITINNGATANVSGTVELRVNMTNKGTINIPASTNDPNQLKVANNATLTNVSSQKGIGTANANKSGLVTDECGIIENYGWLYCVKLAGEKNAINNYGIIYQRTANAVTLITTNSNATTLKTNFASGSCEIGSIVLYNKDANNELVNVDGSKGFIKLEIKTQEELNVANAYGNKANYIILSGTCNKVRTGQLATTGAIDYTPTGINYFEISKNLTGQSVDFEDVLKKDGKGFSLRAIIVPEGKIVTIPDGTTMNISEEACVEGAVLESGTFNTNSATFNGYFNGPKSKAENVGYVGSK